MEILFGVAWKRSVDFGYEFQRGMEILADSKNELRLEVSDAGQRQHPLGHMVNSTIEITLWREGVNDLPVWRCFVPSNEIQFGPRLVWK